MTIARRDFLRGFALTPLALSLGRGGLWLPDGDERCLLVLELAGGNDGLNTVIPVDDANYARLRPKLSQVRAGARSLGDGTALHAACKQLHAHIAGGRGAVVHGVGYEPPDRSHFRSRDIWQVADPAHQRVSASSTGWLGRAAQRLQLQGAGMPAAAIGGLQVPLALQAGSLTIPSLERIEDFQWLSPTAAEPFARDAALRGLVTPPMPTNEGAALRQSVQAVQRAGVALADDLGAALQRYRPQADYPSTGLGQQLQLVARLLLAGAGTRLMHMAFGGFDTHARQLPTHAGLLAQLDAALGAFLDDLQGHGRLDRVAVLVHSEFGRRAAENASQGTDHGAAGPAFVFGGGVRAGVLGTAPDLGQLVDGDVPSSTDFRRVYADLLRWLAVPSEPVLGGEFASVGLWPA